MGTQRYEVLQYLGRGGMGAVYEARDRQTGQSLAIHAAAARHELGLLVGGEEGATLVREAEEAMTTRGIRAPARFAPVFVPGMR